MTKNRDFWMDSQRRYEETLKKYEELEVVVNGKQSIENMNTREKIKTAIASIQEVILEKNKRYGNSALEPIKIFSKLDAHEGIKQRIDDKLMRVQTATEVRKNDAFDSIGYLILLCVEQGWLDFSDQLD